VCWVSPSVFRWIDLWPWLVCGLRQSKSCRWRCWRSVCLLQMSWDSFNTRRDAQVGDHLSYLISTSCLHVAVFMSMSWRVWTPGKTSYRIVRRQSSALCFSVIWSDSAITIEPMLLQISVWYNSVFFSWSFKVKPLYCLFFVSLFSSVSAQRFVCPLATDLLPASVTANTGTLLLLLWTEIKAFREQHIVRCSEVKCHRSKSTHSSDSSFGHLIWAFLKLLLELETCWFLFLKDFSQVCHTCDLLSVRNRRTFSFKRAFSSIVLYTVLFPSRFTV